MKIEGKKTEYSEPIATAKSLSEKTAPSSGVRKNKTARDKIRLSGELKRESGKNKTPRNRLQKLQAASEKMFSAKKGDPDISKLIKEALNKIPDPQKSTDYQKPDAVKMTRTGLAREKYGVSGRKVGVGIVDSGFGSESYRPAHWKDFTPQNSASPKDTLGHGTWCTGHILNMAPEAEISAVRALDYDTPGHDQDKAICKGIDWLIEHKAENKTKVLSISLGHMAKRDLFDSPQDWKKNTYASAPYISRDYDQVVQSIEKAVEAGLVVVVCANNTGPGPLFLNRFADVPGVICVGSCDDENRVSKTSAIGPNLLGPAEVDVLAPGKQLLSLLSPDARDEKTDKIFKPLRGLNSREMIAYLQKHPLPENIVEDYELPEDPGQMTLDQIELLQEKAYKNLVPGMEVASGTSASAPEVAGIVALMMEMKPDLTAAEIKTILRETAAPLKNVPREAQGCGMVNALAALDRVHRLKTEKTVPGSENS